MDSLTAEVLIFYQYIVEMNDNFLRSTFMPGDEWETYKLIWVKEAKTLRQELKAFEWEMWEQNYLRLYQDNQRILEENNEDV